VRRLLVVPTISFGSAVWAIGAFAIVPLFTILAGVFFWTLATFGFLTFRTLRGRRKARRQAAEESSEATDAGAEAAGAEDSVRARVESLS
jgi:membrane protein implicated in regulation of membrane protease activity